MKISPPEGTKDHRALGFPDVPFSAYCFRCWEPVYSLWVGGEMHHGECSAPPGRRCRRNVQHAN